LEIRPGRISSAHFLQTSRQFSRLKKSRPCPFPEQLIRFLLETPEAPINPQENRGIQG
jgi:hypothetical protein